MVIYQLVEVITVIISIAPTAPPSIQSRGVWFWTIAHTIGVSYGRLCMEVVWEWESHQPERPHKIHYSYWGGDISIYTIS